MADTTELDRLRREGWRVEDLLTLRDGVWVSEGVEVDSAFDDEVQEAMAVVADSSWWYRTRSILLIDLLDSLGVAGPLWEVGAGTGAVASALQQHGIETVAVEPSPWGIRLAHERGVPVALQASLTQLRLPDRSITSIGIFDVLEHLDEPEAALREIRRVLQADGYVIVTVPAMSWLWSDADSLAGHRCRYSRKTLRRELESAGFELDHLSYRFSSMVVPVALGRTLKYRLKMRSRMDDVYKQVGADPGRLGIVATTVERRLRGAVPFGTSLFAVAHPIG